MNDLPKILQQYKFAKPKFLSSVPFGICGQIYVMFVGVSSAYGACNGVGRWFDWLQKRERFKIDNPLVEPPVNIARDSGMLCWYASTGFFSSLLITSTSPITVPVIYYWNKKKEEDRRIGSL